jgi:ubiquinone/menaquinone biosynthesis C-methylase UbiE
MGRFDYDRSDIHLCYQKSRRLSTETIELWLEALSQYAPPDSIEAIVDLGCGAGRFAQALADHYAVQVYGIDPSRKMLTMAQQATSSPQVWFVQGGAEDIPLADGTADLLFLSMVYHHIQDKRQALGEFARVLKERGRLCIRTGTVDCLDSYPWLQFFPSARQIEAGRMPSRSELNESVQATGKFRLAKHAVIHQRFAENFGEYLAKISLRGLSSLKAISDDEFQDGLGHLERYCQEQDTGEAVFEDIDLFVFRAAGRRYKNDKRVFR